MTLATIIAQLDHFQRTIGEKEGKPLSDAEFVRRFLPFSSTTWSRVRSNTYAGNLDSIAEQCLQAIEDIQQRLDRIERNALVDRSFIRTTLARAALTSIQRARDTQDRRIVVILAPTGGGKSEIGKYMATKGAIYIEGRKSWRSSYKAFCADVAKAAGRPLISKNYSEQTAETEMLNSLRSKAGLLYIDEANAMSSHFADALKLIVNQTDYTVAVAAIPDMWDIFLQRAQNEVRQLISRCQPILRYNGVSTTDAHAFLNKLIPAADLTTATEEVTNAANAFGAFRTIALICDNLRDIDNPTLADVRASLKRHAASLTASGLTIK